MVTLPRIAPMLATPGTLPAPAAEPLWSAETKYDGQRAVVYLPGDGTLVLRSRSGAAVTAAYPELHPLGEALGGTSAVLDGEIIALDGQGRPDFERLQSRMGLSAAPAKAARLAARSPVHLVLFDALHLDGRDLTRLPHAERRSLLEELALHAAHWSTPASVTGHAREAFALTREHGLEGVILKRTDSRYEPGVRSRAWIKLRHLRTADCVIGGWVPVRGSSAPLPGAVLVGERLEDGRLRYAGSVGTGWSERERAELARLLAVAAVDDCPFTTLPPVPAARWVLPRLVGEVRYATRTRTGLLRQPVWHRLRPDLAPEHL
ncbi:ATP-dependent DNA ligase (plasmid) [Streptomyces sp. CA-294286]|uniref:ATP-dependent DNA ligase n=1 Tax=Streptomyces sp. CA-294286 TaxID=3240070 RepID=UPI003D8BC0BE